MSEPQRPAASGPSPIANADALFDSNEVHTLIPTPAVVPPPAAATDRC